MDFQTTTFNFSGEPSSSYSPSYVPTLGEFPERQPQAPAEYHFIGPDASVGLSTPYLDILSDFQDATSIETVKALTAFLDAIPVTHWRSAASALARLASNPSIQRENYRYVTREARNKQQIVVRPLAHNATIGQALVAVRAHALADVASIAEGWTSGRNMKVASVGGGFPVADNNADATDVINEFLNNLKHAQVVGGRQNPISPHLVDVTRNNFIAINKMRPDTRAENIGKFATGFNKLVVDGYHAALKQFHGFPATVRDNYELTDDKDRSQFTADVLKYRSMAREALKHGRASRGEDNVPYLTTPYYRFKGALKSVNRLAFILSVTEGKIATTTSTQLSQAFGATENGWHVYMDNDMSLDQLMLKLAANKHIEGNLLADRVLVQINVLEEEAKANPQRLFNFLISNTIRFGWAIHDGRVFVTRTGGQKCIEYPKMFAQIAAVNWIRTLHSHAPTLSPNADFSAWFGKYENHLIPVGTFTGHAVQLDFEGIDPKRVKENH